MILRYQGRVVGCAPVEETNILEKKEVNLNLKLNVKLSQNLNFTYMKIIFLT